MKLLSRVLPVVVVAAVALALCGSASAANVIVGPSLSSGEWETYECGFGSCIFANTDLGGTGVNLTSPVSGTVVRFNILGGLTQGTYTLRSMHLSPPGAALFTKKSASVAAVPNPGVQSYSTSLPVAAGEAFGLGMSETASVGFLEEVGHLALWTGERPESGPQVASFGGPEVVGFNAEIQPAPTIASLGATSGPTSGGTSVTITGTDLENVTGVSFAGAPAASFRAETEGQLTAVAPANASAASVSVSVTTIAGKATASQTFKYEAPPAPAPTPAAPVTLAPPAHCVVPYLTGKKLEVAKKALIAKKCTLGPVKKLSGATAKSGRVSKQGAKPGSMLAAGAKVGVTLKPAKPVAKKHHKK